MQNNKTKSSLKGIRKMAGGTDEAPKRTFGCALTTRSKISRVSALKLRSGYWTETVNSLNSLGKA